MGCITITSDGVRTRSQAVNTGVITRSRSYKKKIQVTNLHLMVRKWTVGETEALLDVYEQNFIKIERPKHRK
jgi:hypothetical protein